MDNETLTTSAVPTAQHEAQWPPGRTMSAAHAPLIPELEDALRQISAGRHLETVRRIIDLFVAQAPRFNELHVRLFDRILGRLIVVMDRPALIELARRLASIANAPPEVLRFLAQNDSILVASPVLTRSPRLEDPDLIEIARTKSQAHLFAISGRSSLSSAVSDALIVCGDRDVVRNVAMNHRARLSADGIARLLMRAVKDYVLAEKLARRSDIPATVREQLLIADRCNAALILCQTDSFWSEPRGELRQAS